MYLIPCSKEEAGVSFRFMEILGDTEVLVAEAISPSAALVGAGTHACPTLELPDKAVALSGPCS